MREIKCPHCGGLIQVRSRASLGEGTQRGKAVKLNANRQAILAILKANPEGMTVRQVQGALFAQKVPRQSEHHVNWNYHTIQADLSIMVGGKFLEMTHDQETFNTESGEFQTKKIIRYKAR